VFFGHSVCTTTHRGGWIGSFHIWWVEIRSVVCAAVASCPSSAGATWWNNCRSRRTSGTHGGTSTLWNTAGGSPIPVVTAVDVDQRFYHYAELAMVRETSKLNVFGNRGATRFWKMGVASLPFPSIPSFSSFLPSSFLPYPLPISSLPVLPLLFFCSSPLSLFPFALRLPPFPKFVFLQFPLKWRFFLQYRGSSFKQVGPLQYITGSRI